MYLRDEFIIDTMLNDFKDKADFSLGYPTNHHFNYQTLMPFMSFMLNNVGDPYCDSLYSLNTHNVEREVIDWFAALYDAPDDNYWGYVTNGGTEGNMYGLYIAREAFPHSILYFSEDTHYSVKKIARILDMQYIIVKSTERGHMDYDDLHSLLNHNRDKAAIIFANIGTTMKGACDTISDIKNALYKASIHSYYIHADAALFGMILPFTQNTSLQYKFSSGIDSISVSGHKFIGMPFPSGIVIVKKNYSDRIKSSVEYIGSNDITISGSRNAITPLMFKYAIDTIDFHKLVKYIDYLVKYTINKLRDNNINCKYNIDSNIIWFNSPSKEIIKEWQLATDKDFSHIIIMPHVSKEMIDRFIKDLSHDVKSHNP